MKKKVLFTIASMLVAGSLNAQSISNGGFTGPTGQLLELGASNAGPWTKGDAENTWQRNVVNSAEIILEGNNNVLRLTGTQNVATGEYNYSTAAQDVGPIPSGKYTVKFKGNNQLQTWGNSGLRLRVQLKNYTGANGDNPKPANAIELIETVEMILLVNTYSSYSATFCVPPNLHNQLRYLEFAPEKTHYQNNYFDGVIKIDSVEIIDNSEPYDLAYDYQIDCLTGKVQVMRTTAMNSNLSELFYIFENNPNDPNNLSNAGDVQVASKWFTANSLGWHTIPFELERGKNYYVKRGMWGSCMKWKELRKYNVELQPDVFNSNFDISILCNSNADAILTVKGANQQGKNPHHMFTLYEHFPGTSVPDQAIEHIGYWSQTSTSSYQYQQGPFSFNHPLDPNKHYYVKRGVWDACTPWKETRRYDISWTICPEKYISESHKGRLETIGTISLYPNPVNDELNIETNIEYDSFELYSIKGKLVGTYTSPTISIAKLESGHYLLKVLKDGKISATERFVKE